DGSPPCSTFSMAGSRGKAWGKRKAFREGQAVQRLDDLVFVYLDTIELLRPKVALLENVKGLIIGNAKAYAREIVKRFSAIGYKVQLFLLNAASMGVPQKRERVFFVGVRNDFDVPELRLRFDEPVVKYGEIREVGVFGKMSEHAAKGWDLKKRGDKTLDDVWKREIGVSKN
ncbi:DNA cytosine methyltransferase, partial [Arthrospira platensis SPKY1]|nr:DNA cytosine methyltransferase [Arthrospira platensis SPKY1]